MCGFAGAFSSNNSDGAGQFNRESIGVHALGHSIKHRGPDGFGEFNDKNISLVHRRLAIRGGGLGSQPISSSSGRFVMVYNGEVYNTEALCALIRNKGCLVDGASDTCVVLSMFECFGLAAVRQLEGTFSIALYDSERRSVHLIRDRLGVKPLFYAFHDSVLWFCSELGGLPAVIDGLGDLSHQAFSEYMWFGSGLGEATFYEGVRSVAPGSILTLEIGSNFPKSQVWWDLLEEYRSAQECLYPVDAAHTRDAIQKSCARQLISDVPVSIFLSGGVDSSIVAASVRGHSEIDCVTASFNGSPVSEAQLAATTAARFGLPHRVMQVNDSSLESDLSELLRVYGEPFADAAAVPLFQMCKALRSAGCKVVLQGDGGDELYMGYPRYHYKNSIASVLFSILPSAVLGRFTSSYDLLARFARLGLVQKETSEGKAWSLLLTRETLCHDPLNLLLKDYKHFLWSKFNPFTRFEEVWTRFESVKDELDRKMLTDLAIQLPSQFLPKVDRASMAAGVEARVPLLDELVIRSSFGTGSDEKIQGRLGKHIVRKAFLNELSHLNRRKVGFSTPFEGWMRGPLKRDMRSLVFDKAFHEAFSFDSVRIERLVENFYRGRGNCGFLVWKLYMLAKWKIG